MARPYANDLRRKFLQAYEQGKGTLGELAEQFGVSEGWAKKISATRTRTGRMERPPWRRGPVSRVTVTVQEWMGEQIRKQPDLTLRELQAQLQAVQGVGLSIGRLWLALRQMGLRLKKSHSILEVDKSPQNANVPRWTNILECQCPEVDEYPQMPMSRGGQISSKANVPRWTNILECQCPEVDEYPQMLMWFHRRGSARRACRRSVRRFGKRALRNRVLGPRIRAAITT